MIRRLALILVLLLTIAPAPQSAAAQSYSFSVPRETVDVYWNADGTLALDYTIVFRNDSGASPIDYVDLGIPNGNYSLGGVSAFVDGAPVYDIESSPYVEEGVAVGLGNRSIRSGNVGTVRITVDRVSRVLYEDDEADEYASAVFSPNWFDGSFVHGSTNLSVVFHLPPGVNADEPRYHYPSGNWPGPQEPAAAYDDQDRITYTWTSDSADASVQYTFGASFPLQVVPADAIVKQTLFDKIGIWLADIGRQLEDFLPCCCVGGVVAFIVGMAGLGAWSENQRKKKYLPPKISIEGHGIKRGLTAVEAALLMESPLDRVMTMILFAVVKKGAAKVVSQDPLKLEITQPAPEGLQSYEQDFLKAFETDDKAARRRALQAMTIAAIKSLQEKMKGFSRKETVAYYKSITEKAWQQVTAAGTPEVQAQAMDDNLEWTMLDRDFSERSRTTFGPRPVFMPIWWHNYSPAAGRAVPSAPSHSFGPTRAGPVSLPQLPGADFAASMVNGVQNFSSNVIGDLTGFTGNITQKTNPPPVSSGGYRGGGGGGHSCACACACAGCACACAGGGR
jgi:hypothetical protein